ncbi:hypothetical protein KEM54_001946, partial [Ascosphaera aggregata]
TLCVPCQELSSGTVMDMKMIHMYKKAITVNDMVVKRAKYFDIPRWWTVAVNLCGYYYMP